MADFEIKRSYSFQVYPSSMLGNDFNNVTVLAKLDRESAELLEPVSLRHPLIYPFLPSGTVDNPDDYTYLKLKHPSGVISVIAVEWIQADTVVALEAGKVVVEFNNFTNDRLSLLRDVLNANGFSGFTITTKR